MLTREEIIQRTNILKSQQELIKQRHTDDATRRECMDALEDRLQMLNQAWVASIADECGL